MYKKLPDSIIAPLWWLLSFYDLQIKKYSCNILRVLMETEQFCVCVCVYRCRTGQCRFLLLLFPSSWFIWIPQQAFFFLPVTNIGFALTTKASNILTILCCFP